MVAHAVYTAIDPDRVATVSSTVCKLIREDIGYDGVLITDCLTMDALSGPWPDRGSRGRSKPAMTSRF